MTGDIEAAGDLIRGALLARAVEPAGGGHDAMTPPPLCLNCGTRLIGSHCHRCCQNGHVHRTVGAIGHKIAHGSRRHRSDAERAVEQARPCRRPADEDGLDAARRGHGRAQVNPSLALYKLQSSAYNYSWLLIQLSTPFVALLFLWRRRFGLYDHAVFVTYSLCS